MGDRTHDVLGEVVHPLLKLELVLVEVEGEIGHSAKLPAGNNEPQLAQGETTWHGEDGAVDLRMLNLIVKDVPASVEFYRRLADVEPKSVEGEHTHLELAMPSGFSLELDAADSVRLWHAGWRADPASAKVVVGFSFDSREAVDERYAELTAAGYTGRQPPFDAFWGARYAIVADPDGNDVGLMSPMDDTRRTLAADGVTRRLTPFAHPTPQYGG